VVLLVLAFGVAQGCIVGLRVPLGAMIGGLPGGREMGWSLSWTTRRPVIEMIVERLPNTLLLVTAALLLAGLLALIAALVAVLAHWLKQRSGTLGSILEGVGRLLAFVGGSAPVICVGLLLILVFAIRLDWLPAFGMMALDGSDGLGDRLSHLVLPVVTLALFPALLTGQAVAREVTLPREGTGGWRLWLQGLSKGVGVLLGQIGGLLGASALVEAVFVWPGMGRAAIQAMMVQDYPVLLGALSTYAGLVLIGRLAAELFHWLERLVRVPLLSPPPAHASRHRTARRVWVILALVLLLAPLGVAIAGLTVGTDEILQMDREHVGEAPSDGHPWGTDMLGRDVRARVLRGGTLALGTTLGVAVLLMLLAGPGGAVTGLLGARRLLWSESLADLLLFPTDVLLFIPSMLAAPLIVILAQKPSFIGRTGGSDGAAAAGGAFLPDALAGGSGATQGIDAGTGRPGGALAGQPVRWDHPHLCPGFLRLWHRAPNPRFGKSAQRGNNDVDEKSCASNRSGGCALGFCFRHLHRRRRARRTLLHQKRNGTIERVTCTKSQ